MTEERATQPEKKVVSKKRVARLVGNFEKGTSIYQAKEIVGRFVKRVKVSNPRIRYRIRWEKGGGSLRCVLIMKPWYFIEKLVLSSWWQEFGGKSVKVRLGSGVGEEIKEKKGKAEKVSGEDDGFVRWKRVDKKTAEAQINYGLALGLLEKAGHGGYRSMRCRGCYKVEICDELGIMACGDDENPEMEI